MTVTKIEGQVLTFVNKFKYLSSTDANNNRVYAELDTQMLNTSKAFDRLCSVMSYSSLNSPARHRNLYGIQRGYPKISHLYDVSLAQNTKCQVRVP